MKTYIELSPHPISAQPPENFSKDGECGSEVEFRGKIRAAENGFPIAGLNYEAYEPMARREIERLLSELAVQFPCQSVELIHRLGWVPVSDVSLYLRVRSTHRREGLELLTRFLTRLKQDVPIWKVSPDFPP